MELSQQSLQEAIDKFKRMTTEDTAVYPADVIPLDPLPWFDEETNE